MNAMRHVRLFRNGRNQAVRIPRDMELDADEAILRRDGDRLILEPVPATPLLALLATLKPVDDEFPDIDANLPPPRDVRL
jgi:antitoxin VapB